MKKRSEADSKYTWKLEDMVAEDSQWEQMFKEAAGEISEYASYKGRLAGSADTLYACLLFDDKLSQKIEPSVCLCQDAFRRGYHRAEIPGYVFQGPDAVLPGG